VGESFGVIRLRNLPIDVSLPRRESKRGLGHRGFEIESDPQMDPRDAASRRDFTINAIALDPESGRIFDPFDGVADLENRILRHTTEKFAEDPLRVLRGMQFAARFELQPAPETIELCRQIEPEGLAPERIAGEWKKLILRGTRPSLGLAFLRDCGWIRHFPELEALIGCEQNPRWHPEGDVWTHILHCMDVFASERIGIEREDLIVGFGVLCHDLGKPAATRREEDGRITTKNHESIGVDLMATRLPFGCSTRGRVTLRFGAWRVGSAASIGWCGFPAQTSSAGRRCWSTASRPEIGCWNAPGRCRSTPHPRSRC